MIVRKPAVSSVLKFGRRGARALFLLAVLLGSSRELAAENLPYRFFDLPTLAGTGFTVAEAMNSRGQIVGRCDYQACLWDLGALVRGERDNAQGILPIDLGILDVDPGANASSAATDINEAGTVVGSSWSGSRSAAFRWIDANADGQADPGEMQELLPLPGFRNAAARAINDRGEVVGHSGSFLDEATRATMWNSAGEARDLGSLFGESVAFGINNSGAVVGVSFEGARLEPWILVEPAGPQPLTGLGMSRSSAAAINEQLQVAGYRQDTAILWEAGRAMDLHDILPLGQPGDEARGLALNNSGIVVGCINYESEPRGRESAGFFWREDCGLVLVDSLVEPFGGTTVSASDITDGGLVVGTYDAGASALRAYLMLPETTFRSFIRGDSNSDGELNVTDGISTLAWLFQAGAEPACLDAADADDSGRVDLSDAVRLFSFLFLGANPLQAVDPLSCRLDPTLDDLTCLSMTCFE